MTQPPLAYIALGANLGDARNTILKAMDQLQQWSDQPVRKSSLWRTEPVDCPPGSPQFINAVAGFVPLGQEQPETLFQKLQSLERAFGRQRKKIQNEPRRLDLDLITFGSETRATPTLILPHPRAHLRLFVLLPLSEVAPNLILPGQVKTVQELARELPGHETVLRCD